MSKSVVSTISQQTSVSQAGNRGFLGFDGRLQMKVRPTGRVTITSPRQKRSVEIDTDSDGRELTDLGLSMVSNSRKPSKEKSKRHGLKGITVSGRHSVEDGAFLLDKKFGKQCLSFLTLTIPFGGVLHAAAVQSWSVIMNRFLDRLGEKLEAAGLPRLYVYVNEIQVKRKAATGDAALHAHILIPGRRSRYDSWLFSPSQVMMLWFFSVIDGLIQCGFEHLLGFNPLEWIPEPIIDLFKASTRIESIRKSVAGYMGKYLSKTVSKNIPGLDQVREEDFPKSWWGRSRQMKRLTESSYKIYYDQGFINFVSRLLYRGLDGKPYLDEIVWFYYFKRDTPYIGGDGNNKKALTAVVFQLKDSDFLDSLYQLNFYSESPSLEVELSPSIEFEQLELFPIS